MPIGRDNYEPHYSAGIKANPEERQMRITYAQQFMRPKFTRSSDGGVMPNTGGWQDRHMGALRQPHGPEQPIFSMIYAWALYADRHKERYESGIGDDGVLGPEWAAIGAAIRGLLNGDCGRFDCGTLDSFISNTLAAEGFDPDNL